MSKQPRIGAAREYTDAQLGGPTVENDSTVSVSSSIAIILQGNGDRVGLLFINIGIADVYLNLDSAASANDGLLLTANGGIASFTVRDDFTLPSREWFGICPSGGPSLVYIIEISRDTLSQGGA